MSNQKALASPEVERLDLSGIVQFLQMADPDVRIRTFLKMFSSDLLTRMSGSLSVPFATIALWVSGRGQKIIWGCLTALSVIIASYGVWRRERVVAGDRLVTLKSDFEEVIARKDDEIAQRDRTIEELSSKPKRSAAEQRRYEIAESALVRLGPNAGTALRHLMTNGSLTFGFYNPALPPGIGGSELSAIYVAFAREGLVSQQDGKPGAGERTFAIAENMRDVLNDLLYAGPK